MVGVAAEGDGGVNGLEEALFVDAGDDKVGFVEGFGALGGGADADGGEGASDAGEEGALFGEGAGVGNYGEGVHLQAVVVVEAEGLVLDDAPIELEAGGGEAVARARVAAVEDGHIVFLGHTVDGVEEGAEVGVSVDVFLAVGAQEDVATLLEAKAGVDVAGVDVGEILAEHFGHGGAGDIGALLGEAAVGEVAAGVLGVSEVDVGDDIDDAAVGLLGEAFVLAAVAGFHVEDGDMQALGADDAQAGVGVAQNEDGIGTGLHHELVAGVDDVAHGGAEVVAHGIHIDLGVAELEVAEEDAVEGIVVVLAGVGEDGVEVGAALVDNGGQADNLRACADDNQEPNLAVLLPTDIRKISLHIQKFFIINERHEKTRKNNFAYLALFISTKNAEVSKNLILRYLVCFIDG